MNLSHFSLLGGTSSILRIFLGGTSEKTHPVYWCCAHVYNFLLLCAQICIFSSVKRESSFAFSIGRPWPLVCPLAGPDTHTNWFLCLFSLTFLKHKFSMEFVCACDFLYVICIWSWTWINIWSFVFVSCQVWHLLSMAAHPYKVQNAQGVTHVSHPTLYQVNTISYICRWI